MFTHLTWLMLTSLLLNILTGKEIPAEKADRRPGDPDTLIASSEKARTVLGWKPQFDNIEKIIASAWAWHSSHPKGYDDRG